MSAERHSRRPDAAASEPASSAADLAAESVRRLVDAAVHDLGNLLAVIAGETSLLEPLVGDDPEGRESLAEIRRSLAGAVARLHELAAVTRPRQG
jgi:signal transduction histidine kinase